MTVAEAKDEVGCYDLRGPDYETLLVGPVSELVIDAARIVRLPAWQEGLGFNNGFPNWALYRAIYCGDELYFSAMRNWCVAYAIAYCESGGVRKGLPVDEIGCLAGWDTYYALLNHRWVIAGMDVADVAGVDPKTYRRVRNHVYAAQLASLREYWELLQIGIRQAARAQRAVESERPRTRFTDGRGFDETADLSGDGCFRANPKGSGC